MGPPGRDRRAPFGRGRSGNASALWTADGLLEDDGVRLRLGDKGLFVSNALMADLLGCG